MANLFCSTNINVPSEDFPSRTEGTNDVDFLDGMSHSAEALLKSSWRKIATGNHSVAAASFADAVSEAHQQYADDPEMLAHVLTEASAGIFLAGPMYAQKSIAYLSRAIRLRRKIDGGNSLEGARMYRQMSAVYASCKMYEDALTCLRRVADILESHVQPDGVEMQFDPLNSKWSFKDMEQYAFSRANSVPGRFGALPV
jgi:hypothetical protein